MPVTALAQSAFPAPLPNGGVIKNDPAFPPPPGQTIQRNDPAFPPVNGAAPSGSFPVNGAAPVAGTQFERAPAGPSQAGAGDECMKGFMPLREEAEKRGKMIKAASDRHAPPQEACKLIGNFGQAELKMIKYVETYSAKCGIPPQVADQLKNGHKNTEKMQKTGLRRGAAGTNERPGRPEPERSAGLLGGASGGHAFEEGRQHLRYAERQRPYPMIAIT